ncbi:DUF350 domain-containing protein [Hazenella sp. IB182357]|uniref:DUF350 domain-containing protein n=1 Tax=Polycladospora coralii TaxID=2771432 RepID=A0A926RTW9_9BACL|nr:DUF350 domain-containing protein [Polycladospora coralii]MBD1372208.1 DUF350 domain-containing protein [Polycladospora coralii]MBS7530707.1 DUF350 domain-containing protein [Polycladospora coralii]
MTQMDSLLNFAIYLGVTIPLMILGLFIFIVTTPYQEIALFKEGAYSEDPVKQNAAKAAAHDIGGKLLGLAIVVASAIYHSVSILDLLVWGGIGIVIQMIGFYLFNLLTPFQVLSEIPKGNVGVGIFSSRISIAIGLLTAVLISY